MNCREVKPKLADVLLDSRAASGEALRHVETCEDCRDELAGLRATMSLMDEWAVPEVNPFFGAKLLARLRAEQQASPAGFWERWKARFLYSSSLRLQPLMAGTLAAVFLIGGGVYLDLAVLGVRPQESATVRDLQSLDGNSQVFQQLDSVDQTVDQQEPSSGDAAAPSSND
jgi:hypothetical protein